MKQLLYVVAFVLATLLILATASSFAQAPKVPITYPTDTDKTIARRAEWIEGAKKEGKLIWWGSLRPDLKQEIIAEFNKIYPYIEVDHWRGRGREIGTKIEAEYVGRIYTVDVVKGGEAYNFPRWRKMGMIVKYADIVPGIEKLDKRMYSKFGDWVTPGHFAITPQYNTNLVSAAEAPKNWEDLLDGRWKGQIGLTTNMNPWTVLALAEGGWGIEKTETFLRSLAKKDLFWAQGHSAGHTLMIAGEFKIFAEELLYHAFLSMDKGAPVEWVRVNPIVLAGSSFTLQKMAPHPNAARLFLEWIFSPHGFVVFEKVTRYGAAFPGSGTRISKALEGLDLAVRTEDVILKANELGLADRFSKALGIIN